MSGGIGFEKESDGANVVGKGKGWLMSELQNGKHEAFCQAYVKDLRVRLNATRTYMLIYHAKYKTAMVNGSRLVDKLTGRIDELLQEMNSL